MKTNYNCETSGPVARIRNAIMGRLNSELGDLDLGTFYPVLDAHLVVIGVADATQQPEGYYLDEEKQAYCKIPAGYWFDESNNELVEIDD